MKYKQWSVAPPCPEGELALREAGLSALLARVLSARGITSREQADPALPDRYFSR